MRSLLDPLHSESHALQDAINEQVNAIRVDREAAKRDNQTAAEIIARAIENASNAASGYEQNQRNKEHKLQIAVVVLTFVTAVGALVAAVASWITLGQVTKSTDAAVAAAQSAQDTFDATYGEEGVASRTTRQMASQTAAQFQSADNAKEQIKFAQSQMRLEERAWIGISDPETKFESIEKPGFIQKTITVTALVKNTGRTPAIDINPEPTIVRVYPPTKPIPDYDTELARQNPMSIDFGPIHLVTAKGKPIVGPVIPPDSAFRGTLMNSLGTPPQTVGGGAFVRPNQLITYILGRIKYRTVFDKTEHTTKYCLMDDPLTGEFSLCPSGNAMN